MFSSSVIGGFFRRSPQTSSVADLRKPGSSKDGTPGDGLGGLEEMLASFSIHDKKANLKRKATVAVVDKENVHPSMYTVFGVDNKDQRPIPKPRKALKSVSNSNLSSLASDRQQEPLQERKVHFNDKQATVQATLLVQDDDEAGKVHSLELLHFVFKSLRQQQGKATDAGEVRKLLTMLFPSLVDFIAKIELPLEAQLDLQKIFCKSPMMSRAGLEDIRHDFKLMAFLENYSDVVITDKQAMTIGLNRMVIEHLDFFADKLTSGIQGCAVMVIKSFLMQCKGTANLAVLRKAIAEQYPYLAKEVLRRATALEDLVNKQPNIFMVMGSNVSLKGSAATSKSASMACSEDVTILDSAARRSNDKASVLNTIAKPITRQRTMSVLTRTLMRGDASSDKNKTPKSALQRSRSFVNMAPYVDTKAKELDDGLDKLAPPRTLTEAYDHGRFCICEQGVAKILANMSEPLFDDFATLHVRCLITDAKKKYIYNRTPVKETKSVLVQTDVTYSPKLFI